MKKKILILTSDPDSINYELIKKNLSFLQKKNNKNEYILVGSKKSVLKYLKKKIINLNFIDVKFSKNTKQYLKKCFEKAFEILKKKQADGLINLPLNKKNLPKKFPGFTEYISDYFENKNNETMLLYSDYFSVCPNTTHIPLKQVHSKLTKKKIKNNILNINEFYKKIIGLKKINIVLLGVNPHNGIDFTSFKKTEEKQLLQPTIKSLKKKINVFGPLPADTAFNLIKTKKINCIVGNYHDQVLPIFKFINKFDGINITLGLPFLRVSPDHGTAKNLKKNKINGKSFLYALKFFEKFSHKI